MCRSYTWLLNISRDLRKIIEYKDVYRFLLHMSMVYTYIPESISEFYTYLQFDVSVDVYLYTSILCTTLLQCD